MKTVQITPQIRWLRKKQNLPCGGYSINVVLQQAFQCLETGEITWEDVPAVVEEPAIANREAK